AGPPARRWRNQRQAATTGSGRSLPRRPGAGLDTQAARLGILATVLSAAGSREGAQGDDDRIRSREGRRREDVNHGRITGADQRAAGSDGGDRRRRVGYRGVGDDEEDPG